MKLEDYPHALPPFGHQQKHLEEHLNEESWGLFWEQGTAKTKPIIDTTAILYSRGKIDGLLVVAPPGVERNWKSDELPTHLPPEIAGETAVQIFFTKAKNTQWQKALMKSLNEFKGLAVLLISYNAFMTKEGKDTVWAFLRKRNVLYCLDESHGIKSPNAKRTKSIIASGRYAKYRRILTGTPIAVGPFDLYSQIRFLDQDFWKRKGIGGSVEYRTYFGEWFTRSDCKMLHGYDPGFDKLVRYKNLDQLEKWILEKTDRVLKEDVLDLPPKLYSKRYMEMDPKQAAIYNELRDEYIYEFENGNIIDGELPIVRLLRLQQILCGYVPTGEEQEPFQMISNKNPRLSVMEEIRDECHAPTIIWARFTNDINQIMDLLGKEAVRYDGTIDDDEAELSKLKFQGGDAKWFVGTAQKGGPGLTLHKAKNVVYYSNSFRLIDRLQSEDRAHRAGMDDKPVNCIDICCEGTVDMGIVENLRDKKDISSTLLGDELYEWI